MQIGHVSKLKKMEWKEPGTHEPVSSEALMRAADPSCQISDCRGRCWKSHTDELHIPCLLT